MIFFRKKYLFTIFLLSACMKSKFGADTNPILDTSNVNSTGNSSSGNLISGSTNSTGATSSTEATSSGTVSSSASVVISTPPQTPSQVNSSPSSPPSAPSGPNYPTTGASTNARGTHASDPKWQVVDQILYEAAVGVAPNGPSSGQLSNYTFQVYTIAADASPTLEYTSSYGQVVDATGATVANAPKAQIAIASATKQITSLTILHAIHALDVLNGNQQLLNLSTNAGSMGCKGLSDNANSITLSQLLHQISGLSDTSDSCLTREFDITTADESTLRTCACKILRDDVVNSPGAAFVYSPNNFAVAGAIAEEALKNSALSNNGQAYNYFTWFNQTLADLGIDPNNMSYDLKGNIHDSNLAGGLVTTALAYARFLGAIVPGPNQGYTPQGHFASVGLLEAFAEPYGDSVVVQKSPFNTIFNTGPGGAPNEIIRYGLGNWIECSPQAWELSNWPSNNYSFLNFDYNNCSKKVIQSAGKYGYFPWVSSGAGVESRIAILSTRLGGGSGNTIAQVSTDVHLMLEPVLDAIFKQP